MENEPEKPKNIVLCSDGTGNTANKDRGTNVFKIFEAVDVNGHKFDDALKPQVAFYDDGVGSQRFKILKIAGGAFGWGLTANVQQLYRELARVYNPQDHIYLFGFSRGAYTVRTLAGFIAHSGLPVMQSLKTETELNDWVKNAYEEYRSSYDRDKRRVLSGKQTEATPRGNQDPPQAVNGKYQNVPIRFIGVWDTVAAVGLPFDEATRLLNMIYRFTFPDHALYRKVGQACHALAIDDERKTFHPVLWDEAGESGGRIEQVWFSGVHSNVGGGYPKQGMSLVTLHWMMKRAYQAGLRFLDCDWDHYRDHRNVNGKLYNSRSGLAVYYRYLPRDIRKICDTFHTPVRIHISALERTGQGTEGYAPRVLPNEFTVVADKMGWDDQQSFSRALYDHPPEVKPLLERIRPVVLTRQLAYYLFLGMTLVGVGTFLCAESAARGFWAALATPFSFAGLWRLICHFVVNIWPITLLLVAFGISRAAQSAITARCSGFWHGRQQTLRDALKNTWQSIRD